MDSRPARGDVDLAALGSLLADPGRCRILLALDDGRALPAGRLAREAGVSAATASSHLRKLQEGSLLRVERDGRNRFYRLAGPQVGRLLEAMVEMAPPQAIRSLRQQVRAEAMRAARTCYDHLAGRLGVEVMRSMLDTERLTGGDGSFDAGRATLDRHSGYGRDVDYCVTADGWAFLEELGVQVSPGRAAVRYCVDWTEQRHHLGGAVGAGLLSRFFELDWIRRSARTRAVEVTPQGRTGLARSFGVET
ncbi:MAG: ArsR/SmtB family transcription factor [Candidatus Dormibacteraceae bacterium]